MLGNWHCDLYMVLRTFSDILEISPHDKILLTPIIITFIFFETSGVVKYAVVGKSRFTHGMMSTRVQNCRGSVPLSDFQYNVHLPTSPATTGTLIVWGNWHRD